LGQLRYISAIKQSDGVIGNSSSGLLEVPFLMKGTINIGIRQKGRSRSLSIIDCDPNKASIQLAIQKLHSRSFLMQIKNQKSIFGKPGASKNIIKIIHKEINSIKLVKSFYNLNFDYSE
jgi:GDP/UDP-N,N'-diacetylbacillosamine 2-epimerase (hydrolysing)